MSQNGQVHFKNLAANAARFLKCVWPFWNVMHWRVKVLESWSLTLKSATTNLNVISADTAYWCKAMLCYLLNCLQQLPCTVC